MDSLKVSTGQIALQIIGDDEEVRGIFRFDPTDPAVANKVYGMQSELKRKAIEFEKMVTSISLDDIGAKLDAIAGIIEYFRDKIDEIFGKGSALILFGEARNIDMFTDFFAGITPYYEKVAKQRMTKHTAKYRK